VTDVVSATTSQGVETLNHTNVSSQFRHAKSCAHPWTEQFLNKMSARHLTLTATNLY